MTKRCISFIIAALVLTTLVPVSAEAVPDNSAGAVILIHADSAQVLYKKNADSHMLIASTTKIMTALVVAENCGADEKVTIKPEYTNIEGSSMYLKEGEVYTVEELLYGMMLSSGNDAAVALAYHCGGSIEKFADMMNAKAAELGLCNSSFKNPHGLDADAHYSSAEDLALITCAAMKNELFAKVVGTKSHVIKERSVVNHNKLLWNYEGALGVKTGYTRAAGRSLVSCAMRNDLKLICVTLSDPDDWADHASLYDWAFENFEYKILVPEGQICELPVISGVSENVGIAVSGGVKSIVKKGSVLNYSLELPEFVYAGVKAGECAGKLFLTTDGAWAGEYPLIYTHDVPLADGVKLSAWGRLKRAWFLSNKYGFVFSGND